MKKYLIISANPVYKSTTKLASYALFLKIKKTRSVKFLDLYSKVNAQNFLYFDDINNQIFDKKKERMQQLIMEADEIIFFFPIWWGGFPAILKNFFDVNFSLGFAFEKQGDTSIPMLNGKKISIFCTCSSPSYRYEYAFISYINKHFIECCGMELNNFFIFGNRELKLKKNILKNILAKYN